MVVLGLLHYGIAASLSWRHVDELRCLSWRRAALTWLFDSVITRSNFFGWPVARLVISETLVTFIALLVKSYSITSSSVMLWWTFTMTKLGLVLGLGSVFLAFNLAFGKAWFTFSDSIKHSLELRSSGWIKKSVLFFSSLICIILTAGSLDLIAFANWMCDGLRSIETIIGLTLLIGVGTFLKRFLLFLNSVKLLSSCVDSSAVFLASDKSLSIWLMLRISLNEALS